MTFLDQIHKTRIMFGWRLTSGEMKNKPYDEALGAAQGSKGQTRFRAREHGTLNWVGFGLGL